MIKRSYLYHDWKRLPIPRDRVEDQRSMQKTPPIAVYNFPRPKTVWLNEAQSFPSAATLATMWNVVNGVEAPRLNERDAHNGNFVVKVRTSASIASDFAAYDA